MSPLASLDQLEKHLSHPKHLQKNSANTSLQSVRMTVARPSGSRIETFFDNIQYRTFRSGNAGRLDVLRTR